MSFVARLCGVVLLGIVAASTATAQMAIGRVVDRASRRPVQAVLASLINSRGQVVDSARTDSSGAFYLKAPKPGKHRLEFVQRDLWFDDTPEFELAVDDTRQGEFSLRDRSTEQIPSDSGVDRPATPIRDNPAARYPVSLRARGVQGAALVRLVIDSRGYVAPKSVVVLYATAPEFADAVVDVAYRWRFAPAVKDGAPSPQIACMPSTFRITDFGGTPDPDPRMDSLERAWPMELRCPGSRAPARQPNER